MLPVTTHAAHDKLNLKFNFALTRSHHYNWKATCQADNDFDCEGKDRMVVYVNPRGHYLTFQDNP